VVYRDVLVYTVAPPVLHRECTVETVALSGQTVIIFFPNRVWSLALAEIYERTRIPSRFVPLRTGPPAAICRDAPGHTPEQCERGLKMLCLYLLGQTCLHLTFKPYSSNETYSRKYEKLPNIVVQACKILQKNVFVENVWPANVALFVYVSTHCDETVKWLDCNRCSQLTRWCSGNASALGARGPAFNSRLQQGFLCLMFCFVVVVFLFVCPKHIFITQKFAIPFTILIYSVYMYLTYCKICDRL